jgi:hypothetical protein
MKDIRINLKGIIRSISDHNRDAEKLATLIGRIKGVKANIRIFNIPAKYPNGESCWIEYPATEIRFRYFGTEYVLHEEYENGFILHQGGEAVTHIYWSAATGRLVEASLREHDEVECELVNRLAQAIYRWSATGRPYKKVAINSEIIINGIRVYTADAVVYGKFPEGEVLRLMGNTNKGVLWWSCDPRVQDIVKLIKDHYYAY